MLNEKQEAAAQIFASEDITSAALAKRISVHRNSIQNWLDTKEFTDRIEELITGEAKRLDFPIIKRKLLDKARKGDVKAIDILSRHTQLFKNVENDDKLEQLNNDELLQQLKIAVNIANNIINDDPSAGVTNKQIRVTDEHVNNDR